ncbi:MAG: uracil-DNA glycosylase [Deltaproteobacteria bacterium]|nr:uracil-DNA glycosylase [Deltaproteobacteria bacterium]
MRNSSTYKDDKPLLFDEVVNDLRDYLRYMGAMGCNGFALSGKTRDILDKWGTGAAKVETLKDIRKDLGDCKRCKLSKGRKNIVFGQGNPRARLVFVGEGPGHEEDVQGEPFVGAAGQLLTKIIQAIDLTREDVYICNIVKCRPPRNRNPEQDEIDACLPFLVRQLKAIQPRVICALGAIAAQTLLNTNDPITKLRGGTHEYEGITLIPTYHPAYLLRNPAKKRDVWEDMKKVKKIVIGH